MPVIVNELEVVVAPPPPPGPEPQRTAAAPAAPAALGAFEIAALLERRTRQQLRLFAH